MHHRQALSLCVLALVWLVAFYPETARPHEIRPAVVDLSFTEDGTARFQIDLNLEALVAGISPAHGDTSESPKADRYNDLRRLPPDRLRQVFDDFRDAFLDGISIRSPSGAPMQSRVAEVDIPPVGDTALARTSTVTVLARPGAGMQALVWSWDQRFGPNILRVAQNDGGYGYTEYLTGGAASEPIPLEGNAEQAVTSVIGNYLWIGFTHILPKGLDHILFVVGLFLLSARLRPLLTQVSSFTVAHTVTLALGVTGVVSLPPSIVEPLIAASIVYVAVENVASSKLHSWRPVLVFGFGLLHGLGFAGVLQEIGITDAYFVTALLSFNVGVELGQIAVILSCFLLVGLWFRNKPWYRKAITIPASAAVAVVGAYWLVERTILA